MSTNVLTDPDGFFRQRIEDLSLWKPVLVVLLAAVASLGSQLVIFQSIGTAIGSIIGLIGLLSGFVVLFIFWVVFTGLFYLISIAFGGEGGFVRTLKLTGWGFIPSIFSGILSSIATFYSLRGVTIPQNPQAVAAFSQSLQNSPAVRVVGIIGLIFTI